MNFYNPFFDYPKPKNPRYVSANLRKIENRIIASMRSKEFYDGDRNNGYGGLKYDGRWKKIAERLFKKYKLKSNSKILHIGCDKGYLMYDLKLQYPKIHVQGLEISSYAINNSLKSIRKNILYIDSFKKIPFKSNSFDLVIAIGPVYSLSLPDAISCLKEIGRVSKKGKSFITLGAYEKEKDYKLFRQWTLLGTTILQVNEWKHVMKFCNYKGDYFFNTAKTLNLKSKR